jgi:hypothetical protein
MTTTITVATIDHTPALVDGYTTQRDSRTVQHQILGSNEDAIALRPAGLRSGRLRVLVPLESDGLTLLDALSAGAIATVADSDRATWDMTCVLAAGGNASLTLDDETRDHWWVEFDYQETTP